MLDFLDKLVYYAGMVKLNKNNILAASAAITAGATLAGLAEAGVFHDSRHNITNTPATIHELKGTIQPKMLALGNLTVTLARKTDFKDWKDYQDYNPKTHTVTIVAEGDDPVLGLSDVTAEFKAKPGTHQPDPNKPLYIQASRGDVTGELQSTSSTTLMAPGVGDTGEIHEGKSNVYSASEAGGIDGTDSVPGGAYQLDTRDNEFFADNNGGDRYLHDPVPTARKIVNDQGDAAQVIRSAFEQPIR